MKREIIITKDGSSSLFVPQLNETYHSIHGAIQEAKHVFIKKGLGSQLNISRLRILEIGFGTGLNCLLTLLKSKQENLTIHYTAIEKYPVNANEIKAINYGKELSSESDFQNLHNCQWENDVVIDENFTLLKLEFDIVKDTLQGQFDLVYYDAFAPNKQENMWAEGIFKKIFKQMNPGALLVTYCCKGSVKRTLQTVGFKVQKTDGPPGKREMLIGIKEPT